MTRPDVTVLIPAAGRVPEGILALSNVGTPAMIPVGGRPLIYWTIQYLRSLGLTRHRVAVPERGLFVEDYVACVFGNEVNVEFVAPEPARGGNVGDTVRELARGVQGGALVVLGDTYFRFAGREWLETRQPLVLVQSVTDSYRWCVAEVDPDGVLTALHDKDAKLRGVQNALIGVYYFPDVAVLHRATSAPAGVAGTSLATVLQRAAAETPVRVARAAEWLDCGNPDRQAASHRALLQARAFNELSIDTTLGTITKRSRNVEKFIDEINYLRLLPPDLAILFPRIVSYSIDWADPWVAMEYSGYPNLAEVVLFENVDPGIWEQIFAHVHDVVRSKLMRYARPVPRSVIREMLVDKTRRRLDSLPRSGPLWSLVHESAELTINGRRVLNLGSLWGRVEAAIGGMPTELPGSVIHGDLCFSNILYDLRSRVIKLIDPRGSFGSVGIFGDPRYDVAKLYHSVYGGYDLIVNDLFTAASCGDRVSLDIRTLPRHEQIHQQFAGVFFRDYDRKEILLYTALLFVSMVPLHSDCPRRQIAMYARGLQLLNEWAGL